ncbi:calcium/proton exchanger (plasmid) [Rhizobium sp. CB3171]|uniref:calcium/proton exchanger n=1 Tax=unclassified Rhizobium TaxID=2613769 RepID=UPI0024B27D25|nr:MULTISPECIES: calcium/proton exchanger [unclassified Rhizobium]MDK4741221.1 calcium/proton exchanger [Rhizobium sp. CNPSo 3464]WFU06589.1 calcium/proton exchanger [Rhizobium sp. CB3171]
MGDSEGRSPIASSGFTIGGIIKTEVSQQPLLALVVFVPVAIILEQVTPEAHTLLFLMSIVAIVPLAALLSRATEAVAAKTGDAVGGLLNATLGNLTELVISLAALQSGQYLLVKASLAGAIVTNTLFMLGGAFLFGGLRHHVQEFNRVNARFQACLLFLATIAILVPSLVSEADRAPDTATVQNLSLGLALLLIAVYALGMFFSLRTHRELFASASEGHESEKLWPLSVSIIILVIVTLFVAVISEIFVGSVQIAATHLGMTPAFVGFIVVALVGAAAEMTTAFSAARANRLDLSVSIALGSAAQIALFVAPVLVLVSYFLGPAPMSLEFWRGAVTMMLVATLAATLLSNGGRGAWYAGVMALAVYAIFGLTLFLLPPGAPS